MFKIYANIRNNLDRSHKASREESIRWSANTNDELEKHKKRVAMAC